MRDGDLPFLLRVFELVMASFDMMKRPPFGSQSPDDLGAFYSVYHTYSNGARPGTGFLPGHRRLHRFKPRASDLESKGRFWMLFGWTAFRAALPGPDLDPFLRRVPLPSHPVAESVEEIGRDSPPGLDLHRDDGSPQVDFVAGLVPPEKERRFLPGVGEHLVDFRFEKPFLSVDGQFFGSKS